ncbi:MAG: hypothetical protein JW829_14485 [Pirellulales bacterium]|nr:hypothetical protein [Pirellulales bacterium]
MVVALICCVVGPLTLDSLGSETALPGEWYDTDKTNNGEPFANNNELYGMYWNYWYDANGDEDYTYGEPWINKLLDQNNQEVDNNPLNGEWDEGEVWPEGWLGKRDKSCWAAAAANMILYVGGGDCYISWLYFGEWVSDPGKMWFEGGAVPTALDAEGFENMEYHAQCQPWAFDAPEWVRNKLSDGFPVSLAAYWDADVWDRGPDAKWGVANVDDDGINGTDDLGERGWLGSDDFLNSDLGSTHVVNIYAIDTIAQKITLADNSGEYSGQDYTEFDYTWSGSEFLIPDWRSEFGAAHVNDLATFVATHWQGSGISATATNHWHDPANWSLGSVPDPSDPLQIARVEFVEPGLINISVDTQAQMMTVRGELTTIRVKSTGTLILGNLNFADGQMEVEGQMTVHRADMLSGNIEVHGGSLNIVEDSNEDYGKFNCAGAVIVQEGTLCVDDELAIGVNGVATLTAIRSGIHVSDGKIVVGDTSSGTFEVYGSDLEVQTLYVAHRPTQWGGFAAPGPGHLILDAAGNDGTSVRICGTNPMIVVGGQGAGQVTHHAGDVSRAHPAMDFPTMILGYDTSGTGTYVLHNGIVYLEDLYIGREGEGFFEQNGGLVIVNDTLTFASESCANGTYQLNDGVLKVNEIWAGGFNTHMHIDGGILDLTGSSIQVGYLTIGNLDSTSGALTLVGKDITVDYLRVGFYGQGTLTTTDCTLVVDEGLHVGAYNDGWVNQLDGTVLAQRFYLGFESGGEGHYTLQEGSFNVAMDFDIGYFGEGTFTQGIGSTVVTEALRVGIYSNSAANCYRQESGNLTVITSVSLGDAVGGHGRFELVGGVAKVAETVVGSGGIGTFLHSGGVHDVDGALSLGYGPGAEGTYEFTGGILDVGGDIYVGRDGGKGTFCMGGTTLLGGGTLSISGSDSSFIGWGTICMPVVHEDGGIGILSGCLALEQGYTGSGMIAIFPSGEVDIQSDASVAGQVVNNGMFRVSGGVIELLGGMSGAELGRIIVDAGAHLNVACEIDEIHTLTTAGHVWHQACQSEVIHAVEIDGSYGLLPGAVLTSGRTEVDGRFIHTDGEHEVGQVWIGGLAEPARYTIHAGLFQVADLHIGYSYSDGAAPGRLWILDANAQIEVSHLLMIHQMGDVKAVPGAQIQMTGAAFENRSTDPMAVAGLSRLELIFQGGPAQLDPFEVAAADRGAVPAGFNFNFALGALTLGNVSDAIVGRVALVDNQINQKGPPGAEALYVKELTIGPNSYLDLQGLNLYYITADINTQAIVTGGTIQQVAMTNLYGVPDGMEVSSTFDPTGSFGMGVEGLEGAQLLGGTTRFDGSEFDAAVDTSLNGFITFRMHYLEDELEDLRLQEQTLRLYWWNHDENEWILGGTTPTGIEGSGDFAGINVDPDAYGMGYFGLNTIDNYLWIHATHASVYGIAGLPGLGGDFEGDGDVDGADFLAWQRGESPNPFSSSDLAAWQANFGTVLSPTLPPSITVPEPATWLMGLLGMAVMRFYRRAIAFARRS